MVNVDKILSYNKSIGFVCLFVIPFGVISGSGESNEWIGRIISLWFVFLSVLIGLLFYALNSKTKIVLKGGKLNKPGFEMAKKRTEKFFRACLLLCIALFSLLLFLPFVADTYFLLAGKEKPVSMEATVFHNSTIFGVWFLSQRVDLGKSRDRSKKYTFLYSTDPRLKIGKNYRFLFLKRSKLIVITNELQPILEDVGA